MSSGDSRRRRPAICSGEHPGPRRVRTYCHSHGSRSLRGRRGRCARGTARLCAGQARDGCPLALRASSRLTVLGARPNTVAIVRNDWPWASPRLRVSRSSILMCVEPFVRMATPEPNRAGSVALGVRTQAVFQFVVEHYPHPKWCADKCTAKSEAYPSLRSR